MCDHFTHYSILIPIKDKSAHEVARNILEKYICVLGPFRVLFTDAGLEFSNQYLRQLLHLLKMDHHPCSGFHPASNGLEERTHSIINNYLRIYLDEAPGEFTWEDLLPHLQYCLNQRVSTTTGLSPWYLLYGEFPVNPAFPVDRPIYTENPTVDRFRLMEYARKLTVDNNTKAKNKWKAYFDQKAKASDFKPDDYVLLHRPPPPGSPPKLWTPWRGPYRIVAKIGPENYSVRRRGGRLIKAHAQNIKPFDPVNSKNDANTLLSNYDVPAQFQLYGKLRSSEDEDQEEVVDDDDDPLPLTEVSMAMAQLPHPFYPTPNPYPVQKG